jgi:hypothetical protein
MDLARHAKAIAAFASSIIAALALFGACAALGIGTPSVLIAAPFVATLTAAVVWWVPNRTHGFNVNDIADVLIDAGFDAVAQHQENADDRPPQGAASGQG